MQQTTDNMQPGACNNLASAVIRWIILD
jgi:hypothetical protein